MENVWFSRLFYFLSQHRSVSHKLRVTMFMKQQTILTHVCDRIKEVAFCFPFRSKIGYSKKLTWSKYFSCTWCLAAHIRQGRSSFAGNSSWFTTMLCVSIPHFVSSCTNLSVSYRDRNSAIQTQTNVVCSCKAKNILLVSTSLSSNSNALHH